VPKITTHFELEVYRKAFETAMRLFDASKSFPKEEMYSLTDQMRRSSRSVCGNLAEAWRKRRYEAAFIAKVSDAEGEAAETQGWIEVAVRCGYLDKEVAAELFQTYHEILGTLVGMINNADKWILPGRSNDQDENG
jgi:four helix bundle protein